MGTIPQQRQPNAREKESCLATHYQVKLKGKDYWVVDGRIGDGEHGRRYYRQTRQEAGAIADQLRTQRQNEGDSAFPARTSGELSFEARTHLKAVCTLPGLPVVQRPTHLLLQLRGVAKDQAAPPPSTAVELWVYPPEIPGEWKKNVAAALVQGGMTRLEVFGRGTRLRQFLKERHVEFEEGGSE